MRMIPFLLAVTLPLPAVAWQASSEAGLCRLTHQEPGHTVELTFDPSGPLYTITLSGEEAWPEASVFAMQFNGPRPIFIQTGAHVLIPDRRVRTVADRGFGNVLDGLQFNTTARASLGTREVEISLDGAAPEGEAFRTCGTAPTA